MFPWYKRLLVFGSYGDDRKALIMIFERFIK